MVFTAHARVSGVWMIPAEKIHLQTTKHVFLERETVEFRITCKFHVNTRLVINLKLF